MPFFTLHSLPSSCQTVLKRPWVVACNRARAVYNVLRVMRCSLFNYSAGSLISSIVCESTHPDCFSDVAAAHKHTSTHTQTNPRTQKETEAKTWIHYKRGHNKKVFSHGHVHTHDFTDAADNDYTHGRTCGIPGIVQNDLTAQSASSWRWAALDKAGSCGGSIRPCLCVCRWCNECWRWVGASLSSAICCWHTNTEMPSDTG